MEDVDILQLNNEIVKKFKDDQKNIHILQKNVENFEKILSNSKLSNRIRLDLEKKWTISKEHLEDIRLNTSYNFYIMETTPLIEKYNKIIRKPIKINFMGKKKGANKEKKALIKEFLKISQKYNKQSNNYIDNIKELVCNNCNNTQKFDIIQNNYICMECGAQLYSAIKFTSYKDIERVNMSGKYTYDRKIHFRDCLNQFQGKQNATISKEIYDDLIKQFDLHGLLIKSNNKTKRFSKITKEHILLFLKETGHAKHYEDITLIHYNITGHKPPDISHIEANLLEDFDILTSAYDKKYRKNNKISRKNFINTQYVLYQLLRKYKYPCKRSDFNILKTIDRKSFHDDICKELFDKLGWNFYAIF